MKSIAERFWNKVDKSGECWLWTGARSNLGYGVIDINYRQIKAHRLSWQLNVGDFDQNLCVLHRCDNPLCVNPAHLFLGTRKDNMHDMFAKKRNASVVGEGNPRSKLTANEVLCIRDDDRCNAVIAAQYNVSKYCIKDIKRRVRWKHI